MSSSSAEAGRPTVENASGFAAHMRPANSAPHDETNSWNPITPDSPSFAEHAMRCK